MEFYSLSEKPSGKITLYTVTHIHTHRYINNVKLANPSANFGKPFINSVRHNCCMSRMNYRHFCLFVYLWHFIVYAQETFDE